MRNIYTTILCSLALLSAACSKKSSTPSLPGGSIAFQNISNKDTLATSISILGDSTVTVGFMGELSGKASSADHWVSFAVDTTKMAAYRAKYGDASLLPATSYFLYRSMARIAAGSSLSDSGQINIFKETLLKGYATYVLPIVIRAVDGNVDGPQTSQVLYLIFKTGKPAFISKDGWTIDSYSSYYSTFVATNLIDNDEVNTYWTSNITLSMPQWVVINFNSTVTFTAVNYYLPTLLQYPTNGGYPTSIQIETSMDGAIWDDKGVFAGNISNNMQSLNTGLSTAKYLRFTVLACVQYASRYSTIFISGIKLIP
jgi:hypothetical protein